MRWLCTPEICEPQNFSGAYFMGGMVLQNAGYPGGRAYPIAFLRWPGTAHPAAQRPPGTTQAEGRRSSSPRRRENEVMGTTVPADPLVKRDTPRRAGKGAVVRRLLVTGGSIARC